MTVRSWRQSRLDGHDRRHQSRRATTARRGMEVVYNRTLPDARDGGDRGHSRRRRRRGLSMLSRGTFDPGANGRRGTRSKGSDIPVIVGGIVPNNDLETCARPAWRVFGPGASAERMVASSMKWWHGPARKVRVERRSRRPRRYETGVMRSSFVDQLLSILSASAPRTSSSIEA